MANNLTGNPWIVDTPSATPVHLGPGRVFLRGLQWSGYNNAGDQCTITDGNGNTVVNWQGSPELEPLMVQHDFILYKPAVVVLTSGRVAFFMD